MVDNIRVNGKMVQSMGKEYFNGQMEGNMMVIMLMMKERDMEFYNGLVDKNIWDFGRKVCFMEMVKLLNLMDLQCVESGLMEKKLPTN